MSDKFEDRLAHAIDEAIRGQLDGPAHDSGTISTERLAAVLVGTGIVADPVQHQQDLVAIMDKQVRDAEAFTHEFITTTYHPDELMPEDRQAMTRPGPEWDECGEASTYHRQVTAWREVHRA